eukprot:364759-Chlamydomonas_euryale.AAC.33
MRRGSDLTADDSSARSVATTSGWSRNSTASVRCTKSKRARNTSEMSRDCTQLASRAMRTSSFPSLDADSCSGTNVGSSACSLESASSDFSAMICRPSVAAIEKRQEGGLRLGEAEQPRLNVLQACMMAFDSPTARHNHTCTHDRAWQQCYESVRTAEMAWHGVA